MCVPYDMLWAHVDVCGGQRLTWGVFFDYILNRDLLLLPRAGQFSQSCRHLHCRWGSELWPSGLPGKSFTHVTFVMSKLRCLLGTL